MILPMLLLFGCKAEARNVMVGAVPGQADRRSVRLAKSSCRFDERIENRLEIESRAADDLEHVGRGSLLLQRLAQVVGALAQFVEQARVLDGDDRLIGEGGDQLDLPLGERANLLAIYRDGTNR